MIIITSEFDFLLQYPSTVLGYTVSMCHVTTAEFKGRKNLGPQPFFYYFTSHQPT